MTEGSEVRGVTIDLTGQTFVNQSFRDCTLHLNAYEPGMFTGCMFENCICEGDGWDELLNEIGYIELTSEGLRQVTPTPVTNAQPKSE